MVHLAGSTLPPSLFVVLFLRGQKKIPGRGQIAVKYVSYKQCTARRQRDVQGPARTSKMSKVCVLQT